MGSGYFGEPNLGSSSERGSNSSRKGKKSGSEKPRQPQRGLGVAQLEKIRLHGHVPCAYGHNPPSHHNPNFNHDHDMRVHNAYSSIPSSSFSYSSSPSSSSYGFNPNMMMGLNEYERANVRYGDSQPTTRWDPNNNGMFESQYHAQSNMPRHFLNAHQEDSQRASSQKHRSSNSHGSGSQNSESSDTQDVDLELRLSL